MGKAGRWSGPTWHTSEGVSYRVPVRARGLVMALEEGEAEGDYILRVTLEELEGMGFLERLPMCQLPGCEEPVRAGERGAMGKYCSREHKQEAAWWQSDQGRRFLELKEGGAGGS